MQFTLSALFLSLAAFSTAASIHAPRQTCAEADRFGQLEAVPSTLSPGQGFTVHADFTCSLYFDIVPKYIDYYLEVTNNNNGHEPPMLLARREYHSNPSPPPADTFTASLPYGYYFSGANYSVVLDTTYAINGTDNSTVYVVGSIEYPITVTNITN